MICFCLAELSYDVRMTPECSDLDCLTSASVIFMAILRTTEHIDVIGERVYVITYSLIMLTSSGKIGPL